MHCATLERVVVVAEDLVVALAELYLDTDVRAEIPRLAQRIVSSGLPRAQIEHMWRRQITPALHWNLKSAAGEWAGFDRHWLLAEVSRPRTSALLDAWPLLGDLLHRVRSHGAEPEFRVALWLAERLQAIAARARSRRVALWQALVQVYYSVDGALIAPHSDFDQVRAPSLRSADSLARRHELDVGEMSDEFRAICDVLAQLLSREQLATVAESHVAAWLDRLAQPKH